MMKSLRVYVEYPLGIVPRPRSRILYTKINWLLLYYKWPDFFYLHFSMEFNEIIVSNQETRKPYILSTSFCSFLLFLFLNPFALHFSSSMIHRCQIPVNIKYKIYFCLHPLIGLTVKQPPFVASPTRKSLHKSFLTFSLPITWTLHTSISEFSMLTHLKDKGTLKT